jgi:SAM-dependent methyltransferase
MKYFADTFLVAEEEYNILDVGSQDVNGTYKPLFKRWNYKGLDIASGKNVDILAKSNYDFGIYDLFDVVVSGNCMEHVEAPWLWIKEVERVTKRGGLVCIIVPFSIGEHRYPVDCWRILPDGFRYLMEEVCKFEILENRWHSKVPKGRIQDTYCIAKKI